MLFLSLLGCTGPDSAGPPCDSGASVAPPSILINEVLARNDATNADGAGVYSDWVELYNTSGEDASLLGVSLSDTVPTVAAARLPDTATIPAHGYLLVWCGGTPTASSEVSVPFSLDKDSDSLYLLYSTAADATIVGETSSVTLLDSVSWQALSADVAVARVPDGEANWAPNTPTPAASNGGG